MVQKVLTLPIEDQLFTSKSWRSVVSGIRLTILMIMLTYSLAAQREYTFSQIDLPHNYYYKELYLPQLTSGPSSFSWSPDGKTIVYAMAGSLWIQDIQSNRAIQITDGDGQDYQPDWSPDGRKIIFTRYNGSSLELMLYDFSVKSEFELTNNKAVNVEPQWSPDGSKIAYVSTDKSGHFLLYTAEVIKNDLRNVQCMTPDRESEVTRYYYSSFDHAINPTWSSDGKHIYFISNREIAHGTGDIVRMSIENSLEFMPIHHEETSWRTRPDISPDGTRMVYSSYLGTNWHQLYILPSDGGYPIPITYGDYDNTNARWSPDGDKIAFISNRNGNTSLWIMDAWDGGQAELKIANRVYLNPKIKLHLTILDENNNQTSGRVSITDEGEKFFAPEDAWIHGDDSNHPNSQIFEYRYFHCHGECDIIVPKAENLDITIYRGLEYDIQKIEKSFDTDSEINVNLTPIKLPAEFGKFWNGDLHVHMNYGGNYRNTPKNLVKQGQAEGLNFIYNLIVNKEQRIPDVDYFSPVPDDASTADILIMHGQEFHTSYWGHLGLLNLDDHLIIPDYVGYPYTGVASLFPHNSFVADRAHKQNALVGYVHPFLTSEIFPAQSDRLKNALPVDAALGKVDYYEIPSFADHMPTEYVWHQLLNCGLRIPAGGGTDAMANYASLRGPVGVNRVFIKQSSELSEKSIYDGIKKGNGFSTNGPLLGLMMDRSGPGDELYLEKGNQKFNVKIAMRSLIPVEHLQLIHNGKIIKELAISKNGKIADWNGSIKISGPGWITLRAWSESAHPDLPDFHLYATTNPIYINGENGTFRSGESCQYFVEWVKRMEKYALNFDNLRNEKEREYILKDIRAALKFYENCASTSEIKPKN